jgi:hypothetical protein
MSSLKQLKLEQKSVAHQRQVFLQLNALVGDIERSEKTILALNRELELVNSKHQGPRNTRQDVDYLTGLLDCAKKKLAWEKQITSLQKRAPALMEEIAGILNDPKAPTDAQMRDQILQALQAIQTAMQRLQTANAGMGPNAAPASESSTGPIS